MLQLGMIAQYAVEAIERDAAAEVVDVVYTDIGSKPAHHDGQVVVRAAVQGSLMHPPIPVFGPDRPFKLVLDVEQPYADRGGQQDDWDLHEQKRADPDKPDNRRRQDRESGIGCQRAEPGTPVQQLSRREPLLHQEEIGRSDAEQDQRMTVTSVSQASPARAR